MSKSVARRVCHGIATTITLVVLVLPVCWGVARGADSSSGSHGDASSRTWYDVGHDYVAGTLERTAVWLDTFFGDRTVHSDDEAGAYLDVVLDAFYSGVEGESENGIRFRGGADLPRLDRRLRLMFTSDADAAVTGRELAGTARDEVKDTDRAVGLRYLFRDRKYDKFSLGGGLAGGLSPEILLAARHVHTQPWTAHAVSHVTSTAYWKSEDGPGVSLLLDYAWAPDAHTLWRYNLFGNYRDEIRGFDWSSQAKWAKRLNDKTAVSARLGVQGSTQPSNILTEGWLKLLYRRNFLRSWLFLDLEPGLSCHHRADYRVEPTMAVRLEIQFREK